MSKSLEKVIKNLVEFVYKHLEADSGTMILITSIIGVALSTIAQTGAVILNKNYTTSQKAFMVPQELAEGCMSICSMFIVTKPIQSFAKKYVSTGKILSKDMIQYLKKISLIDKRGDRNFDLPQAVNKIVEKIKKSDEFINSSTTNQKKILSEHNKFLSSYDSTLDATSAIATTFGSIVSTALISPLVKNTVAANYQKATMNTISNSNNYPLVRSYYSPSCPRIKNISP